MYNLEADESVVKVDKSDKLVYGKDYHIAAYDFLKDLERKVGKHDCLYHESKRYNHCSTECPYIREHGVTNNPSTEFWCYLYNEDIAWPLIRLEECVQEAAPYAYKKIEQPKQSEEGKKWLKKYKYEPQRIVIPLSDGPPPVTAKFIHIKVGCQQNDE